MEYMEYIRDFAFLLYSLFFHFLCNNSEYQWFAVFLLKKLQQFFECIQWLGIG